MDIFDLHCDYLCQHQMQNTSTTFTYPRMVAGEVRVQAFAIFVSRHYVGNRWLAMLEQAEIYSNWCKQFNVQKLLQGQQFRNLSCKRSAILTVEGLDDVPADIDALELLYAKGVRSLSLTWNGSNAAADGALSEEHGGLTKWGKKVVRWCNQSRVLIDASHLSEQSFWDLYDCTDSPIYCSHSNTKSVHFHPRNLTDEQIQAIIACGGIIGITLVPDFLNRLNVSGISDVIKNVYRICELGGASSISFGSDFDGVEFALQGIEHPGKWQQLVRALSSHFPHVDIEKFTFFNAARLFSNWI